MKLNSSTPSATYMRQSTGSSLVQVMACCLFSTKPLPEPILAYCLLDSWEQISMNSELEFYHSKMLSAKMAAIVFRGRWVKPDLDQEKNGCHFADNFSKIFFLNENHWIWNKISLHFVATKYPIDYEPFLIQVMAGHWIGNKLLLETIMPNSMVHICITQPQWVHGEYWTTIKLLNCSMPPVATPELTFVYMD